MLGIQWGSKMTARFDKVQWATLIGTLLSVLLLAGYTVWLRSQPKPASGRDIVDVEPQQLTDYFRNYLTVQAQALTKPYIGKWMKVSGKLRDVTSMPNGTTLVTLGSADDLQSVIPLVSLQFSTDPWGDHLAVMQRGDGITALGKIESIQSYTLLLTQCEILDHTTTRPVTASHPTTQP